MVKGDIDSVRQFTRSAASKALRPRQAREEKAPKKLPDADAAVVMIPSIYYKIIIII